MFRPVVGLARKAMNFGKTAEQRLSATLNAAERVNAAPLDPGDLEDYTDFTDESRDSLRRILDKVEGDGLWRCCQGHEQEVIHYKGLHPFKRLKCIQCKHIACHQCCSTDVLKIFRYGQVLSVGERDYTKTTPFPFGKICPRCGLSHRSSGVEISKVGAVGCVSDVALKDFMCACGRLTDTTWLCFYIGPIYEYRRKPHEAFAVLSRQRAESAVRMQRERSKSIMRRVPLPTSPSPYLEDPSARISPSTYASRRRRQRALSGTAHESLSTWSLLSARSGRSTSELSRLDTSWTRRRSSVSFPSSTTLPLGTSLQSKSSYPHQSLEIPDQHPAGPGSVLGLPNNSYLDVSTTHDILSPHHFPLYTASPGQSRRAPTYLESDELRFLNHSGSEDIGTKPCMLPSDELREAMLSSNELSEQRR